MCECTGPVVNVFIEAMAGALKEAADNISALRRDDIMATFQDLEQRIPDDDEARLALTVFKPHIAKYAHVLLDFYEDSGLSPEEFKSVGEEIVDQFKLEPEFPEFSGQLKAHLQDMAVAIASKTHEDVRETSAAFVRGTDVSENMAKLFLIKVRALSHLLLIVYKAGKKEGETEEEFQAKAASDIEATLGGELGGIKI